MLQTLFYIPHFLFEGPLLYGWLALGALIFAFLAYKGAKEMSETNETESAEGTDREPSASNEAKPSKPKTAWTDALSFLPVYIIVALVIHFLLPKLEVAGLDGEPMGLAVRGYGFFMLLAIVTGLSVAWLRCRQTGFNIEVIFSLSFWMIICGIIGARIFYLVQKNSEQPIQSLAELPMQLIDMTEGGLVVYGAVIGGVLALLVFVSLKKLPLMRIADIIAPGMAIGLAIGRLGCLMNGCCFGGTCTVDAIGIQFPPGSPPYLRQLETGLLLGLDTSAAFDHPEKIFKEIDTNGDKSVDRKEFETWKATQDDFQYEFDQLRFRPADSLTDNDFTDARVVESIEEGSLAEPLGIEKGELIAVLGIWGDMIRAIKNGDDIPENIERRHRDIVISRPANVSNIISIDSFPDRGIQVHPTQIYSAINATLIFLFLWFYFPFRKGHGEVFAWMLILYAVTRFCLESIRIDELPFIGPFTISQTISIGVLVLGVATLFVCRTRFPLDSKKSKQLTSAAME